MSQVSTFRKRQMIDKKRGEDSNIRKKKFAYLKNTGQYSQYYNQRHGIKIIKIPLKRVEPVPEPVSKQTPKKVSFWTRLIRRIKEGF